MLEQDGAIFEVEWTALPAKARCVGFECREQISRLYELDLYLTVQEAVDLDPEELLLSQLTLTLDLGTKVIGQLPLELGGVATEIELLRSEGDLSLYRVTVSPRMWRLTQSSHSRIWTKRSLEDITAAVLEEAGLARGADFELRITRPFGTEDHVTQYKESNFDFLNRWFEREGWYYFFEQTGGKDRLVIVDDASASKTLRSGPIRYFPQSAGDSTALDSFRDLAARTRLLPAHVRISDYDYGKPGALLSSRSSVSKAGLGEVAVYGRRAFSSDVVERVARVRAEGLRATESTLTASGAATHLRAGYRFEVTGHPRADLNRGYLAVEVVHQGHQPSLSSAWGKLVPATSGKEVYRTTVRFIADDIQYRAPLRTPWPRVDGFENAVVDGPASSSYAQIDDQGRYLVRFKFDEGTGGGPASTWVRMAQPHGGAVEGFHFPLRKGTEVICSFFNGDPDCPMIVGVVPTAVTPSPIVGGNCTQNIIRTGSDNRLVCEDSSGAESIDMTSPGGGLDCNLFLGPGLVRLKTGGSTELYAKGNIDVNAGASVSVLANGGEFHTYSASTWYRDVGANAKEQYDQTLDQSVKLAADFTYHAKLDVDVTGTTSTTEKATTDTTVNSRAGFHYEADHLQLMLSTSKETVGILHSESIEGGRFSSYLANEKVTINGPATLDIAAKQDITVVGHKNVTSATSYTWNAKDVNLTVAGAFSSGKSSWFSFSDTDGEEHVHGMKISAVNGLVVDLGMAIKKSINNTIMLTVNGFTTSLSGIVGEANGISLGLSYGSQMNNKLFESKATLIQLNVCGITDTTAIHQSGGG